jgi:hypothetical protein
MPPAFAFNNTGTANWNGEDWVDANPTLTYTTPGCPGGQWEYDLPLPYVYDKQGGVTYSLVAGTNGTVPTHDPITGSTVACYFTSADAYSVYQFDIIATDSTTGQTDKRHVVICVNIDRGYMYPARNTYAAVATGSGATQIQVSSSADQRVAERYSPQLVLVSPDGGGTTPHGKVEIDPNHFGSFLYTPDPATP